MISGTCLCGEVSWRLDGAVELINFCHCSMCRKIHGAPFGAFAHGNASEFRWLRGEASISRYQSSHNIYRCFCRVCGSSVPVVEAAEVCIPAGGMKLLTRCLRLIAFRPMSTGEQILVVGPNHASNANPHRRAFGRAG